MPGLIGIVAAPHGKSVEHRYQAMFRSMERGGRLKTETLRSDDGSWALGRVHLGVLQPKPQLAIARHPYVLFHGDLHNADALRRELSAAGEPPLPDDATIVGALYRKKGRNFARDLRGAFAAAVFDDRTGTIVLATDRVGSYPLYWFAEDGRFVFASELAAAVRAQARPALNPRAAADLFKFAFPLGDRTLAAGIDLVPTASTVVYDRASDAVSVESYASLAGLFQPRPTAEPEYVRQVEETFAHAIERAIQGQHRWGLSLSGGLDTRVILSALDRLGRSEGIATFTLGGRGCADEVIACQLARMGRTNHKFVALDDHYLEDLLPPTEEMCRLTDGMYVSHGFTEMLALQGFAQSDAEVLLRGHCGEVAKASTAWPLHTDARIFAMKSRDEFVPYLFDRVAHVSRGDVASQVLAPLLADAIGPNAARRSLEESIADAPLAPADLCSYVYLKEYTRRVTVPSLDIFRNVAEVRMPFADVEFLGAVLQGPAAWRDGTKLHQQLIAANNRAYLRVRNPNTGAPAGAGPLQEYVLDKMNTVLRRLNVYGYRHYHSFDGWMRKALLDTVDKVLLSEDTLGRGVFREPVVRDIVARAHAGTTEHDDLLQTMVLVELWQRQNL